MHETWLSVNAEDRRLLLLPESLTETPCSARFFHTELMTPCFLSLEQVPLDPDIPKSRREIGQRECIGEDLSWLESSVLSCFSTLPRLRHQVLVLGNSALVSRLLSNLLVCVPSYAQLASSFSLNFVSFMSLSMLKKKILLD